MSTLTVQNIQGSSSSSNTINVASGHTIHQAGAVLQVLQATVTSTVTIENASNSDVITQAITPKFSSSKILVRCSLSLGGGDNSYGYARLLRGSTAIGQGDQATGSQVNCSFQCSGRNFTYQGYRTDPRSFEFLDSPNTTSATTYKVNITSTSDNIYLNRSATVDTGNAFTPAPMSTLTLMEIAQ